MASVPETLLRSWSLSESIERHGWGRSLSFVEVKDQTVNKLRGQLLVAEKELRLKGNRQEKLEALRNQVEVEITELTANLFENANKMVVDANVKRMDAERELEEAQTKVGDMQAEVKALKTLISSGKIAEATADAPKQNSSSAIKRRFSIKKIKRSRSTQQSPVEEHSPSSNVVPSAADPRPLPEFLDNVEGFDEFIAWKKCPELDESSPFIASLLQNDVRPCLTFTDTEMTELLVRDVVSNSLSIEPTPGQSINTYCKLIGREATCSYAIKFSGSTDSADVLYITQRIRDKIIAVCELFLYLSYVRQRLIRSQSDQELFEQIQLLRRRMVLTRLGLPVQ